MYSEKIILSNLEEFEKQYKWMPVYHSIAEVDEFRAYVDSVVGVKENNSKNIYLQMNRKLTKSAEEEMRRWVQNEQALCCLDSNYWQTRYAYFCDAEGEVYRFKNRDSQKVFDAIIAEFERDGIPIEMLVLKARQQGISTKVALIFLQRLLFLPNSKAVMSSVDDKKSQILQQISTVCLQRQPWWLIPKKTVDNKDGWKFDNDSMLSLQSGKQATGIAQGTTPNLVHISELADIPNPKKLIEEGLFRAVHPSARNFMVLEGTGGGDTGWLADKWRGSKNNWSNGGARLFPMFIPWPMAPDLYPTKGFMKAHPRDPRWKPMEETRKHVKECEIFIRNTPYLAKIMGSNWSMPLDQQWFWEFNYKEALLSKTVKTWTSQMPANDKQALTGQNDSAFDTEVIDVITNNRPEQKDYEVFGIFSKTIEEYLEPEEEDIDYLKARILVRHTSHRGQRYEWELVPLKDIDEEDEKTVLGKILVFERPRAGADYAIGIDTAEGLGKEDEERTSLEITRNETGGGFDVQVAELCSNRISGPKLVGFAAGLAAWYGKNTKDPRGCKFVIEQRMRAGDDCQAQLMLMGFTFHHEMVGYDGKVIKENGSSKYGWYSNAWSVPMLTTRFKEAIEGGWYVPKSKWLISETADLQVVNDKGKTKLTHKTGHFDDRFRAAAQSFFTRHAIDVLADRAQKRYSKPQDNKPTISTKGSRIAEVSVGEDWTD